jgi:hypothetical protein
MRAGPTESILGRVDDGTITITLELRAAGDSVSGRALAADGVARAFSGWLGLVSVLDALVESPSTPVPDGREQDHRHLRGGTT